MSALRTTVQQRSTSFRLLPGGAPDHYPLLDADTEFALLLGDHGVSHSVSHYANRARHLLAYRARVNELMPFDQVQRAFGYPNSNLLAVHLYEMCSLIRNYRSRILKEQNL